MNQYLENIFARLWNRMNRGAEPPIKRGLDLGVSVIDGQLSRMRVRIPHDKRAEHTAVLGITGTGKSSLLRYMATQDIRRGQGFCFFDLHGDATPNLLRLISEQQRRIGRDLSEKLIVIEPADLRYSVGLNVLEQKSSQQNFVQIAEFAQILKQRWKLSAFGARTEELLRNALHVLADNHLTLLELVPLLTNYAFRSACLRKVSNPEVRGYFSARYNRASEGMQGVMRDAILNKVSAFTADPHFRHILGQKESTFSLIDCIDQGHWILLNLEKGRLGEQATTLGSLFLTKVKNALFSRQRRSLYTLYCDEIQNLVTFDSGLDTLLSEARKFAISIVSANQFLDQYPASMRSAILAVATHVFFRLSSTDADKIATALDGGKTLAALLKNLPQRQMVVKVGHHRWRQAEVPWIEVPDTAFQDLYNRCRNRWAKKRTDVEKAIRLRSADATRSHDEVLHEWE